jgi:hypothetical protein
LAMIPLCIKRIASTQCGLSGRAYNKRVLKK